MEQFKRSKHTDSGSYFILHDIYIKSYIVHIYYIHIYEIWHGDTLNLEEGRVFIHAGGAAGKS